MNGLVLALGASRIWSTRSLKPSTAAFPDGKRTVTIPCRWKSSSRVVGARRIGNVRYSSCHGGTDGKERKA